MTQALAAIDNQAMTPAQYQHYIAEAEGKARVLTDIVERQKLYTVIGSKKHLHVEAWEVLGAGYGLSARTAPDSTQPLYAPDGTLLGVKARVEIVDSNGIAKGGAESFCTYDETETKRDGTIYKRWEGHPLAQLAGMAQTRATARAYRQMIAWVVQLAGYSPTPFEELDTDKTVVEGRVVSGEATMGLCPKHNVAFQRKTGTSKAGKPYDFWACPSKDGDRFCQEKPGPRVAEKPAPTQPAEESSRVDHWAALEQEARVALREMGYTPAQAATILGAPLDAWLAADKLRTPAEAMRLLREAKAKQATGG